jgi:hypothetical protein
VRNRSGQGGGKKTVMPELLHRCGREHPAKAMHFHKYISPPGRLQCAQGAGRSFVKPTAHQGAARRWRGSGTNDELIETEPLFFDSAACIRAQTLETG